MFRRNIAQRVLILCLTAAVVAYGQGNSFRKIRYNGGTVQTKVSPKDWGNRLTVTSEEIRLELKDGQILRIDPKRVYGLSYGQEAHRRVGTMTAVGIWVPLAFFGLIHKTRLHFVGIEFTTPDGRRSGLLLQAHKNTYRAVLMALRGATGAPIAVAQEDRRHVPTGVETVTVEGAEKPPTSPGVGRAIFLPKSPEAASPVTPQPASRPPAPAPSELSVVQVGSTPEGADITVDGKYVGNTPSSLRLASGDHRISIEKAGFQLWQRTLAVHPGGNITIDATLEKLP
jgi:hypothetical protein